ncbi:DoxX family protein, partial [Flavobacteriaceae bacterium]|nr:DoxX family protein [Flavobacteriaceae bacterium]
TPKWVYRPDLVNIIIGIIEIGLALGLVLKTTRSISAIGIILLLIIVFPANLYHLQISIKKKKNIIGTIIRLPIQGLLIYWAYIFI